MDLVSAYQPGQGHTREMIDAEWEEDTQRLVELGEILDEMLADAEIDVFHKQRSTQDDRLAYLTELVAHGSSHALDMARRELRMISLDPGLGTTSLMRRVITRPKRASQILPDHYKQAR